MWKKAKNLTKKSLIAAIYLIVYFVCLRLCDRWRTEQDKSLENIVLRLVSMDRHLQRYAAQLTFEVQFSYVRLSSSI